MEKCDSAPRVVGVPAAVPALPACVASTFCIVVLVRLGWLYEAQPTLAAELQKWAGDLFYNVTWSWNWERNTQGKYDGHLWTIPVEFAHSMLLFLTILCLSRVRLRVRQTATALIVLYSWCCGRWAAVEFIGGMFLAELHILQSASSGDPPSKSRSRLKMAFQISVLVVAAFIGSWPIQDESEARFYRDLVAFTPPGYPEARKFWYSITALCVVWCSGDLRPIKRFLEGPMAQYSGRISYAIYIVHGPVLHLLQRRVTGHADVPSHGTPGKKGFKKAIVGSGLKGLFGTSKPGPAHPVLALRHRGSGLPRRLGGRRLLALGGRAGRESDEEDRDGLHRHRGRVRPAQRGDAPGKQRAAGGKQESRIGGGCIYYYCCYHNCIEGASWSSSM